MIRLEGITKRFKGTTALYQVDLSVRRGEIYGFLGHNGAGKTTTLKIVNGFLKADEGQVVFGDKNLRIGYMPESPSFYPTLTLAEYMGFVAKQCQNPVPKGRLEQLAQEVGLGAVFHKRVAHFSRGMKQRAAFAVALLDDPDLLLLDEPLSALDPEGRKEVMTMIGKLKRQGKTILISTHILSDVESICDRVGVLRQGEVILESSLSALKEAYVFPIVDISLKEAPEPIDVSHFKHIEKIVTHPKGQSFYLRDMKAGKKELLRYFAQSDREVLSMSQRDASLEEIYLLITKKGGVA